MPTSFHSEAGIFAFAEALSRGLAVQQKASGVWSGMVCFDLALEAPFLYPAAPEDGWSVAMLWAAGWGEAAPGEGMLDAFSGCIRRTMENKQLH